MVRCSRVYLERILRGQERAATTNAPADLEVVGVVQTELDHSHDTFALVCRSSEWEPTTEGAAIPQFELVFEER